MRAADGRRHPLVNSFATRSRLLLWICPSAVYHHHHHHRRRRRRRLRAYAAPPSTVSE